jgi:hypothetical protein
MQMSLQVDSRQPFCSHHPVKIILCLVLLAAFSLSACTTLANRRDLYRPKKANGPWTAKLDKM